MRRCLEAHPALRLGASTVAVGVLVFACLAPTQIELKLSTDVDCEAIEKNGVAIYGGDPKTEPAITEARACAGGGNEHDLGTLVVTPSAGNDDKLSVVVIAGVTRRAAECAPPDYQGCIVARRRMRFVPHEPLRLPIELARSCLDVPCNEEQTCFRGGCIDSEVVARNGCLGPDCDSSASGNREAGPSDASTDAGPATNGDANLEDGLSWALVVDSQGKRVTGLAKDGSELWFAMNDGANMTVVHGSLAEKPFAANPPIGPQFGQAYGLTAKGGDVLIAGQFNTDCGLFVFADAGGEGVSCAPGQVRGTGVAAQAGGLDVFWLTSSTVSKRSAGDLQEAVSIRCGYAESLGDYAYCADDRTIRQLSFTTGAIVNSVDVVPRAGFGFGIGTSHWFVATTDGDIFAVNQTSKVVKTLARQGSISSVEDILYDETANVMYVAAKRDETWGVHVLSGIDPARLP